MNFNNDVMIYDEIVSKKVAIKFENLEQLNHVRRMFHMEPFTIEYWNRGGLIRVADYGNDKLSNWIYPLCYPVPNSWTVLDASDLFVLADSSRSIIDFIRH